MITFRCSCGKTYQLQDRVAGREVRCNQCQKTLLVPTQSQNEPVVPLEDQRSESAGVPAKSGDPRLAADPGSASPGGDAKWKAVPLPKHDDPEESPIVKAWQSGGSSYTKGGLAGIVVFVLLVGFFALFAGIQLGQIMSGFGGHSPYDHYGNADSTGSENVVELLKMQAVHFRGDAETEKTLQDKLTFPASEAAETVKEPDDAKRRAAMQQLAESRQKALNDWSRQQRLQQTADFYDSLASVLNVDTQDSGVAFELAFPTLEQPEQSAPAAKDWSVTDKTPIPFVVRTADGAPALLSLDGDPTGTAKGDKSKDPLGAVADALTSSDEKRLKDNQPHTISYRIDSASSGLVRVVWPGEGVAVAAELDGEKAKEFRFSLFLSEKSNAVHKPGKPEGIDKTLEFSSIALRLYTDTGFVEFTPTDKERLVPICELARTVWIALRIPANGNDAWRRTDHGLSGPLRIRRIELQVVPTGNGITFWIDHLAVGR